MVNKPLIDNALFLGVVGGGQGGGGTRIPMTMGMSVNKCIFHPRSNNINIYIYTYKNYIYIYIKNKYKNICVPGYANKQAHGKLKSRLV